MSRALAEADFVQENAPERPEFKVKLFAEMDEATPPGAILASSSSGIPMDVIQTGAKRPERCVIGHPFNPPHIVPLVEVVGGAKTSEAVIERAMSFYASIGKKPIRLHKSLPGHAANRLQAALYKEILSLIQRACSAWRMRTSQSATGRAPLGVMGQSLQWHLAEGRRHPSLHGASDAAPRGHDEGSPDARRHAGAQADHRRGRGQGDGWPLRRAARPGREPNHSRHSRASSKRRQDDSMKPTNSVKALDQKNGVTARIFFLDLAAAGCSLQIPTART